jgi:hypothetical protein
VSALLGSAALGVIVANFDIPAVRDAFYLQDAGVAFVFPAMGALILTRRPGHRIGWLFLATASLSVAGAGSAYALYTLVIAPGALPGGAWAAWIASWAWTPFLAMPTLLVLLFPDGRAPSARWGLLARLIGGWLAGVTVLAALLPGRLDPFPAHNPIGLTALQPLRPLADALIGVVMVGFAPLCLAGLVWRFRHADGDERAQLKWFVTAAVVALAAGLLGGFLPIPVLAGDAIVADRAVVSAGRRRCRHHQVPAVRHRRAHRTLDRVRPAHRAHRGRLRRDRRGARWMAVPVRGVTGRHRCCRRRLPAAA